MDALRLTLMAALVSMAAPAGAVTCPIDPPRKVDLRIALGSPYSLDAIGRVGAHTWTHVHRGAGDGWTSGFLSLRSDGSPLVVMSPLAARAVDADGTQVHLLGQDGALVSLDLGAAAKLTNSPAAAVGAPRKLQLPW